MNILSLTRRIGSALCVWACLLCPAYGQQPTFQIPGQFVFDIYMSDLYERADPLSLKIADSRGINFYYLQEIRLGGDKLTLHPGIGISSSKFSFREDITLVTNYTAADVRQLQQVTLPTAWNVRRSLLATEYLDAPLELRFQTAPGYRALRFGVGVRLGYLLFSRNKLKYHDERGNLVKEKERNDFMFSQWRYGLFARAGLGKVNFFASYDLNEVFEPNALQQIAPNMPAPHTISVGITFFTF